MRTNCIKIRLFATSSMVSTVSEAGAWAWWASSSDLELWAAVLGLLDADKMPPRRALATVSE
jgi:hypothetical protein